MKSKHTVVIFHRYLISLLKSGRWGGEKVDGSLVFAIFISAALFEYPNRNIQHEWSRKVRYNRLFINNNFSTLQARARASFASPATGNRMICGRHRNGPLFFAVWPHRNEMYGDLISPPSESEIKLRAMHAYSLPEVLLVIKFRTAPERFRHHTYEHIFFVGVKQRRK